MSSLLYLCYQVLFSLSKKKTKAKQIKLIKTCISMNRKLLLLFTSALIGSSSYAQQDRTLYQYMLYKPLINYAASTAYTGVSFAVGYRKQWVGLQGAPEVAQALVSIPVFKNSNVGVMFENDRIGANKRNSIKLAYAYSFFLNRKSKMAFSLTARADHQNVDYTSLYASQVGDPISAVSYAVWSPNFDASMFFNTRKFYAGLSVSNILRSDYNFTTGGVDRNATFSRMLYNFQAGYEFSLSKKVSMTVSTLERISKGSGLTADLNIGFDFNKIFGIGVSGRSTKDIIPIVYLNIKGFTVSYAYGYTFSELRKVNSGTHEVFLRYFIKSKKELITVTCPRF